MSGTWNWPLWKTEYPALTSNHRLKLKRLEVSKPGVCPRNRSFLAQDSGAHSELLRRWQARIKTKTTANGFWP
jgi:hypothetical protein